LSQPFWIARVAAGLLMFFGYLCFLYNIYLTARGVDAPTETLAAATA
jgi:cbb3-type cytochrome oxidase subunit 1